MSALYTDSMSLVCCIVATHCKTSIPYREANPIGNAHCKILMLYMIYNVLIYNHAVYNCTMFFYIYIIMLFCTVVLFYTYICMWVDSQTIGHLADSVEPSLLRA